VASPTSGVNTFSSNKGFDDSGNGNMILQSKMNEPGNQPSNDLDFNFNGEETPF
jgi:hypothetical protein